jgi:ABC-2 type transport system permease protein
MTTPTVPAPPPIAAAPAATSDWTILTLRLVRWELRQAWRRVMGKVLLGLLLGLYVLEMSGLLLAYVASSASASNEPGNTATTLTLGYLTFPRSASIAVSYVSVLGVILLTIFTGASAGGDYRFGTYRLAISRGIGRGQALLAKVLALIILAVGVVGLMLLLGALLGVILGPSLGGVPEGLSVAGIGQLVAYWAAVTLRLIVYSLIALFFATVGRSAAAGIGGALGFVVVELIVVPVLQGIVLAERISQGIVNGPGGPRIGPPNAVTNILTVVHNLFVQPNADALTAAASQGPLTLSGPIDLSSIQNLVMPPPAAAQALLVLLVWCALALGGSYLLVRSRDVTD